MSAGTVRGAGTVKNPGKYWTINFTEGCTGRAARRTVRGLRRWRNEQIVGRRRELFVRVCARDPFVLPRAVVAGVDGRRDGVGADGGWGWGWATERARAISYYPVSAWVRISSPPSFTPRTNIKLYCVYTHSQSLSACAGVCVIYVRACAFASERFWRWTGGRAGGAIFVSFYRFVSAGDDGSPSWGAWAWCSGGGGESVLTRVILVCVGVCVSVSVCVCVWMWVCMCARACVCVYAYVRTCVGTKNRRREGASCCRTLDIGAA